MAVTLKIAILLITLLFIIYYLSIKKQNLKDRIKLIGLFLACSTRMFYNYSIGIRSFLIVLNIAIIFLFILDYLSIKKRGLNDKIILILFFLWNICMFYSLEGKASRFLTMLILISVFFIILGEIYNKFLFSKYIKYYKKIRNGLITIESYKDLKELNRDINVEYSPAVLSYLIDQKVEVNKDITATLLNLYAKRIIDIKKEGKKYIIKKGKKEGKLSQDEQYIYDCFMENKNFSMKTWINAIRKEYFKYGFNAGNKKINLLPFYLITTSILALIIYVIMRNIPFSEFYYWDTDAFVVVSCNIAIFMNLLCVVLAHARRTETINDQIFFTYEGKSEIKKWIRFKRFIKQYTLIEERTIEETQIYEKYIPYAMALGINENYKDLEIIQKADIIKFIINDNIENFRSDLEVISDADSEGFI